MPDFLNCYLCTISAYYARSRVRVLDPLTSVCTSQVSDKGIVQQTQWK